MKTICIKTNNDNALDYLLKNIQNLPNVSFSCKKFKVFQNFFIHYKGSDSKIFLCDISELLSSLVLDIYEDNIVKKIISSDYFYFNSIEQKEILLKFQYLRNNDLDASALKENKLSSAFYTLLEQNNKLYLKGIITFRLFNYIEELKSQIDSAVNQYLIEKEYNEFVSLLRIYINTEHCKTNLVHLIYNNGSPTLLDENKQIIRTDSNILNAKYLSDITFSDCDIALNTLLNLIPKKIYLHLIDSKIDEFITTLKLIFENRIVLCTNSDQLSLGTDLFDNL